MGMLLSLQFWGLGGSGTPSCMRRLKIVPLLWKGVCRRLLALGEPGSKMQRLAAGASSSDSGIDKMVESSEPLRLRLESAHSSVGESYSLIAWGL